MRKAPKELERRLVGILPHPNSSRGRAGDYVVPIYEVVGKDSIRLERGKALYARDLFSSDGAHQISEAEYMAICVLCDVSERLSDTFVEHLALRDSKDGVPFVNLFPRR
jgi:hypothetical protein